MNSTVDPLEPYYLTYVPQTICGIEVPCITKEEVENTPCMIDRYFTRHYYIKPGAEAAPYLVLFHSNRICLVCLAAEHPAFKEGITSLNYDVGNADRSKNAVVGKGKKGAMALQTDSTLAIITTAAGKTYKVPSCVRGKLIETHKELADDPKLFARADVAESYVAIVLPKPENCEQIKASLLTEEQYRAHLLKNATTEHVIEDTEDSNVKNENSV